MKSNQVKSLNSDEFFNHYLWPDRCIHEAQLDTDQYGCCCTHFQLYDVVACLLVNTLNSTPPLSLPHIRLPNQSSSLQVPIFKVHIRIDYILRLRACRVEEAGEMAEKIRSAITRQDTLWRKRVKTMQ